MGEVAAVVRERPLRVHTRNVLADFDALVERAVVAQFEGRQGTALLLVDEATRIAHRVGGLQIHRDSCELPDRRISERELAMLKRQLTAALAKVSAVQLQDAQNQAENAKRFLRRFVNCDCSKRTFSLSGRPLW